MLFHYLPDPPSPELDTPVELRWKSSLSLENPKR